MGGRGPRPGATGFINLPADRRQLDQHLGAVRARLGEPAFASAWAEGEALTVDEAVAASLELGARPPGPADQPAAPVPGRDPEPV